MRTFFIILLIAIILFGVTYAYDRILTNGFPCLFNCPTDLPATGNRTDGSADPEGCPDEKIINRMPGPGYQGETSYYIKDGERREISDYDPVWIMNNCNVPEQIVY